MDRAVRSRFEIEAGREGWPAMVNYDEKHPQRRVEHELPKPAKRRIEIIR